MVPKYDRMLSLALAHAKLIEAANLLKCSINTESAKLLDRDAVRATEKQIRQWGNACFEAARKKPPEVS